VIHIRRTSESLGPRTVYCRRKHYKPYQKQTNKHAYIRHHISQHLFDTKLIVFSLPIFRSCGINCIQNKNKRINKAIISETNKQTNKHIRFTPGEQLNPKEKNFMMNDVTIPYKDLQYRGCHNGAHFYL